MHGPVSIKMKIVLKLSWQHNSIKSSQADSCIR